MSDRALMRQALEALELEATRTPIPETAAAIAALRARLAEPEPEPVAWQERQLISSTGQWTHWYDCRPRMAHQPLEQLEPNGLMYQWRPLYTAPPTRRLLTDEEIEDCRQQGFLHGGSLAPFDFCKAARAIERKITGGNDE